MASIQKFGHSKNIPRPTRGENVVYDPCIKAQSSTPLICHPRESEDPGLQRPPLLLGPRFREDDNEGVVKLSGSKLKVHLRDFAPPREIFDF